MINLNVMDYLEFILFFWLPIQFGFKKKAVINILNNSKIFIDKQYISF